MCFKLQPQLNQDFRRHSWDCCPPPPRSRLIDPRQDQIDLRLRTLAEGQLNTLLTMAARTSAETEQPLRVDEDSHLIDIKGVGASPEAMGRAMKPTTRRQVEGLQAKRGRQNERL